MRKYLHLHYLPKRGTACLLCQAPLGQEEAVSSLEEDSKSSFDRRDICVQCHQKMDRLEGPHWHSQNREEPKQDERRSFDIKALDIVKQCATATGEVHKEALFLIVHLLRRKKIRLVEKQLLDGRSLGVFEVLLTKERLVVDLLEPLTCDENLLNNLLTPFIKN